MSEDCQDFNRPLYPESVNDETVNAWAILLHDARCPICSWIEGCSHTVRERARALIHHGYLYDQQIDAMMAETRRVRHSSPWQENKRQRILDKCQDARNTDRLAAYKRKRADLGHWFP